MVSALGCNSGKSRFRSLTRLGCTSSLLFLICSIRWTLFYLILIRFYYLMLFQHTAIRLNKKIGGTLWLKWIIGTTYGSLYLHKAAVSCSPTGPRLGGIKMEFWCRQAAPCMGPVHGWCMVWWLPGLVRLHLSIGEVWFFSCVNFSMCSVDETK